MGTVLREIVSRTALDVRTPYRTKRPRRATFGSYRKRRRNQCLTLSRRISKSRQRGACSWPGMRSSRVIRNGDCYLGGAFFTYLSNQRNIS